MTEENVKLAIGALLHDIGKLLYRYNDGRNHSRSGYEYLKDVVHIEDRKILEQVLYHHASLLKNARIENTELRASVPAEFSFRITNASAYNWKMNKKAFTPEINADGSVQISMNAGDKLTVSL